ncbi:hypothetical protein ACFQ2M_34005 [Kitasatospora saccharophila]
MMGRHITGEQPRIGPAARPRGAGEIALGRAADAAEGFRSAPRPLRR